MLLGAKSLELAEQEMGEIWGHLVLRGTGTDLLLEAAAPIQCEVHSTWQMPGCETWLILALGISFQANPITRDLPAVHLTSCSAVAFVFF